MDNSNTTVISSEETETSGCEINMSASSMGKPFEKDFSYVLCAPVLSLIVVLGLAGNVMCLIVFYRCVLRPRIYLYLIALTVWDILLLTTSFLLYSVPVWLHGRVYMYGPFVPAYPLVYTFTNMAHTASIWTVVVLAVERYFALCRPFRHLTWDTELRAKLLLFTVSTLSVLYHVPNYFEIQLFYCTEITTRRTIPAMNSSNLRENRLYKYIYRIIGGLLFFSVGPLLILSVLTTLVSIAVREKMLVQRRMSCSKRRLTEQQRKPQRHDDVKTCHETSLRDQPTCNNNNDGVAGVGRAGGNGVCSSTFSGDHGKRRPEDHEDKKMDLMLVVVMIKFCLCHTLPVVLDISETLLGDRFRVPFFEYLVDVSNILVVVNSSCNFLVYWIFGAKFRDSLSTFFCGRRYFLRGSSSSKYSVISSVRSKNSTTINRGGSIRGATNHSWSSPIREQSLNLLTNG